MSTEKVELEIRERERLLAIHQNAVMHDGVSKERSLSKTTKFVNRVRKFYSEPSLSGILKELSTLDLSMYIEEVVDALAEASRSMKLRDSLLFVEIACNLSIEYPDFGEKLLIGLRRHYDASLNDNLRLRVCMRVLSELILTEAVPSKLGKEELVTLFYSTVSLDPQLVTVGLIRLTAVAYWSSKFASSSLRDCLEADIKAFYELQCPALLAAAEEGIQGQEAVHAKQRVDRGSVDAENEARYAGLKSTMESIRQQIALIQASFGFTGVVEEKEAENIDSGPTIAEPADSECVEIGPFVDETETSFYTDLTDLSARLPATLLVANPSDSAPTTAFTEFLARLMRCSTGPEADDLAITFFESSFNSKSHRRLIGVKFLESEVGPNQCRFLSTVAPFTPDLVPAILTELKKKAIKLNDRAIKTLGELTKFSVAPPGMTLDLLQLFANEPTAKTAEAAAWLLISCGRFLAQSPDSATVTDNLTARLLQWATSSTTITPKIKMAVEDSYFQAKPRLVAAAVGPVKSDLERYIEYLMQVEVYRIHEDTFLRQIRQLPWSSPDGLVRSCLKRQLLAMNSNFPRVYCLVSLLAGLIKFEEEFVIDVIDSVFENFQVMLEKEDFRQAPIRVRLARFIGELYVFNLIDSATVVDVLYQIIGFRDSSSFGAGEPSVLSALHAESLAAMTTIAEDEDEDEFTVSLIKHKGVVDEPEWSYVRINLVATIINTVAEFFIRGKGRTKMIRFLLLFRRYVLARASGPIPTRVNNIIADMFEVLSMQKFDFRKDSLSKIDAELDLVIKDLAASASQLVRGGSQRDDEGSSNDESSSAEEVDSSFESCAETDYLRDTDEEIDHEMADFDREMQAMLVDSVAEARTRRPTSSVAIGPLGVSEAEPSNGGFRVMSKSSTGKAVAGGTIFVPNDNKLRHGQESYRIEQEAANQEKERLKRYIMDYQRTAQSGVVNPVPTVGRPISLAQAAGIEGDFDLKWSNRDIKQKKSFRRF